MLAEMTVRSWLTWCTYMAQLANPQGEQLPNLPSGLAIKDFQKKTKNKKQMEK